MENRLKELCSVNSEMQEKYYLYCQIKKSLTERLRTVPAYFPHFSIHDASHSSNIIKYLSMLLGRDNIEKLSVSDLLVLCVAAYAHDIIHFIRREMLDFTAFPVFFVSNLLLVQRKKYYFNRAMVSRNCSIVL